MTINGTMTTANLVLGLGDGMMMEALVELNDDILGRVGVRRVPVTDPAVKAQVLSFVEQMLPSLSQEAGFPITLPPMPEA